MTNPALVAHLRALGKGEIQPLNRGIGVCEEIRRRFDLETCESVADLMVKWPKYSGDWAYPIPRRWTSPDRAFRRAVNPFSRDAYSLWAKTTYGNSRRELCLWLADQLEVEG